MAPFRARDRSNRSGRGQVEHNVLEGLPINQYREVDVTVGMNQMENKQTDKDAWPELPLPRDFHMLPEHSQQLLRAARAGRVYKPPAPPEDDRENMEEDEEQKQVQQGFTVRKYIKVPRHLEGPEPEYLAKRRKGLPSQYAPINALAAVQQTPMRETKVKKLDAEGNVTVYKALVPEGQTIENEVQATDVIAETAPAAAAPGTVVEGVGVVNAEGVVVAAELMQQTPPRRRPPPPKKKKRGPGRGHKKVVFAEGSQEQGTPASGSDLLGATGIKQEGLSIEPSDGGDTPMADAGDEEEGDEGDEEDASDHDEQEESSRIPVESTTPLKGQTEPEAESITPASEAPLQPVEVPLLTEGPSNPMDTTVPTEPSPGPIIPDAELALPAESGLQSTTLVTDRDLSSSPDLPLAIAHSRQNSLNQIAPMSLADPNSSMPEPVTPDTAPTEPLITEPTAELVAESVEPIEEPIAAPTAEPVVESGEPVPELVPEAAAEVVTEPITDSMVVDTLPVQPVLDGMANAEPVPLHTESVPIEPALVETTPTDTLPTDTLPTESIPADAVQPPAAPVPEEVQVSGSEPDLLGDLERQLEKDSESMAGP